jgi:hypothetical protein
MTLMHEWYMCGTPTKAHIHMMNKNIKNIKNTLRPGTQNQCSTATGNYRNRQPHQNPLVHSAYRYRTHISRVSLYDPNNVLYRCCSGLCLLVCLLSSSPSHLSLRSNYSNPTTSHHNSLSRSLSLSSHVAISLSYHSLDCLAVLLVHCHTFALHLVLLLQIPPSWYAWVAVGVWWVIQCEDVGVRPRTRDS